MGSATQGELSDLIGRAIEHFASACADEAFTNGSQRQGASDVTSFWGQLSLGRRARLLECMRQTPGADPYLVALVEGKYHTTRAWEARGSGWASTVTENGWQGFHGELDKARLALTTAHGMHPNLPYAAEEMIAVSMGSRGQLSPREWFGRAVAAQFDYGNAYDSLLWALRPRWRGSHREMYEFGLECLRTNT